MKSEDKIQRLIDTIVENVSNGFIDNNTLESYVKFAISTLPIFNDFDFFSFERDFMCSSYKIIIVNRVENKYYCFHITDSIFDLIRSSHFRSGSAGSTGSAGYTGYTGVSGLSSKQEKKILEISFPEGLFDI